MIEEKPKRIILCDLAMVLAFILGAVGISQLFNHSNPLEANSLFSFLKDLLGLKYALLDFVSAVMLTLLAVKIGADEKNRVNQITRPWNSKQGDNITDYYENIDNKK
ncbi:hypothetical protein ACVW0P_004503 [Mucilaginibacter sp. UYNi724]